MPDLPPPPPSASPEPPPTDVTWGPPRPDAVRTSRPGDATGLWRTLLGAAWAMAFFAYAAIWQASVQIGIATWWLGPRSDPSPALVRAIPFFVIISLLLRVIYDARHLPVSSLVAAAAMAVIALPDLSRSVPLALTELLVAAMLAVVGLGAFGGRYRAARAGAAIVPVDSDDTDGADGSPGRGDVAVASGPHD